MLVVAVPTTPRSIELDREGREEWLVDSCKFRELLEERLHPTVIHVVVEDTHMDVEKESGSGIDLSSQDDLSRSELWVCHLSFKGILELEVGDM